VLVDEFTILTRSKILLSKHSSILFFKHHPSANDGGEAVSGKKLLEGGASGFDALLAGAADFRSNYLYLETYAIFWTSTEANEERAYHQGFRKDGKCDLFAAMKGARISIRLIKD